MMNKTVGILSMQRVVNYGSFLQAWALKNLIMRAGADSVNFIDIRPGRPLPEYDFSTVGRYSRRFIELSRLTFTGRLGCALRDRSFNRALRKQFERDFFPMLELGRTRDRYDLAVIGSDEMFNCCQAAPWGFTTQLYGDIPNADRVVSYAASFGNTTLADIQSLNLGDEITAALNNLESISVRDDNSLSIVRELTGRDGAIDADPVLVYDFEREKCGKRVDEKGFVLIYSYSGRISDRAEIDAVKSFASERELKIYSLMSRYDWCDRALTPNDPFEVLEWFRAADYVLTDTFHGTVLSAKARARFAVIVRESNENKLMYLLRQLGLEARRSGGAQSLSGILADPVDYRAAEEYITEARERTHEYLSRAVAGIKNTV